MFSKRLADRYPICFSFFFIVNLMVGGQETAAVFSQIEAVLRYISIYFFILIFVMILVEFSQSLPATG